jgi:hypothetical protein
VADVMVGGWLGEDGLLDEAGEAVAEVFGGAAVEDAMGQAARRWHDRR